MNEKALTYKQLSKYVSFLKKECVGKYISSPSMYSSDTFYFHFSNKGFHSLVISLEASFPRIYMRKEDMDVSSLEGPFLFSLKKEVGNAYIKNISQINEDRVLEFELITTNSVFKEERKFLLVELIPNHPNMILLDSGRKIVLAYKTSSLEDKRPIMKGLKYIPLEKGANNVCDESFSFEEFNDICLEKEKDLANKRKNEKFSYAFTYYKNKKKLLERKIRKLEEDIIEANKHLNDGEKGDAIYVCYSSLNNKQGSFDYEGLHIELDPSKSLSANAENYYKRAKKSKESIRQATIHLEEARKDLENVSLAYSQLLLANETGLETFAKDFKIPSFNGKKKKEGKTYGFSHDSIPYFIEHEGTKILFGKNAKQNTYLTFMYDTSKEHLWFHVTSHSGSHVIIRKDNPNDDEIRIAAEICLINSSLPDGDVMVAKRKNVHRGHSLGEAIVKEYSTIHLKDVSEATKKLLENAKRLLLDK